MLPYHWLDGLGSGAFVAGNGEWPWATLHSAHNAFLTVTTQYGIVVGIILQIALIVFLVRVVSDSGHDWRLLWFAVALPMVASVESASITRVSSYGGIIIPVLYLAGGGVAAVSGLRPSPTVLTAANAPRHGGTDEAWKDPS
jgi:hypothetical protein